MNCCSSTSLGARPMTRVCSQWSVMAAARSMAAFNSSALESKWAYRPPAPGFSPAARSISATDVSANPLRANSRTASSMTRLRVSDGMNQYTLVLDQQSLIEADRRHGHAHLFGSMGGGDLLGDIPRLHPHRRPAGH